VCGALAQTVARCTNNNVRGSNKSSTCCCISCYQYSHGTAATARSRKNKWTDSYHILRHHGYDYSLSHVSTNYPIICDKGTPAMTADSACI
jgi:hypothetical protein